MDPDHTVSLASIISFVLNEMGPGWTHWPWYFDIPGKQYGIRSDCSLI